MVTVIGNLSDGTREERTFAETVTDTPRRDLVAFVKRNGATKRYGPDGPIYEVTLPANRLTAARNAFGAVARPAG